METGEAMEVNWREAYSRTKKGRRIKLITHTTEREGGSFPQPSREEENIFRGDGTAVSKRRGEWRQTHLHNLVNVKGGVWNIKR